MTHPPLALDHLTTWARHATDPATDPATATDAATSITNYLAITGQGPDLAVTAARIMAHQALTRRDRHTGLTHHADRLTAIGHPPDPDAPTRLIDLMDTAVPPHLAVIGIAVEITVPHLADRAAAYATNPANVILALAAAGPPPSPPSPTASPTTDTTSTPTTPTPPPPAASTSPSNP